MVHGSWEELLDEISISNDLDLHDHDHDGDFHQVSKKHGIWCTMLRKIGVKNKRCKEVRIVQPEPFEEPEPFEDEKAEKKKKKKKFFKIPKQLKSFKKKKSSKSKEIYESFQNENDYNSPPEEEVVDNTVPDVISEVDEQSSSHHMERYSEEEEEEDVEETFKYIGKTVHIDVLPDSYDLLEESGYETTSNSPVLNGDPEFWSFEDLRDGDEEELTVRERFQRGWKSERAKSMRRSIRKSTKQSWKGLQMSLRHQMNVPNAQTVFNAVSSSKNGR